MDINNELQPINTFVKGMNTDVSDALIDSSQYRYAENVRLQTNTEENSGELRLIEGTTVDSNLSNYGKILAMTAIRDIIIVITRNNNKDYILSKDTKGDNKWYLKYQSSSEDEKFGDHLSLVTRWETENDVKLYIADGVHELMYINIKDPNATYPLVGIKNIQSNINCMLAQPIVSVDSSLGTIPPTKVQYAYRLYKNGGAATTISPLSKVITLYKSSNEGYSTDIKESNKSVKVEVQQNGSVSIPGLDYMQIFRISYQQVGQQPSVAIVYDGKIKDSFIDRGYNIEDVSYADFLSYITFDIKPTVIESKENYMFAANVEYIQDNVDDEIKDEDVIAWSSGNRTTGSSDYIYNKQFENIKSYNVNYWKNSNDDIGGDGKLISWKINIRPVYVADDNKKYESYNPDDYSPKDLITTPINSLRQGEVYRYGAIFYRKDGKKTSVKWIADIMAPINIPDTEYKYFEQFEEGYSIRYVGYKRIDNITAIVKQIGIDFTIHTDKLPSDFIGVEIVRCDRTQADKISLLQGVAGHPYYLEYKKDGSDERWLNENIVCAPYFISGNSFGFSSHGAHEDYANLTRAYTDFTKLVVACPEYSYQPDDIQNALEHNNLNIQQIGYYHTPTIYSKIHDSGSDFDTYVETYRVESYKTGENNSSYWQMFQEEDHNNRLWYTRHTAKLNIFGITGINVMNAIPIAFKNAGLIETHGFHNLSFYSIYGRPHDINPLEINVKNIAFTKSPEYNQFVVNGTVNYANSSVNIGSAQYINWSVPLLYYYRSDLAYAGLSAPDNEGEWHYNAVMKNFPALQPAGSTGQYILVDINNQDLYLYDDRNDEYEGENVSDIRAYRINIRKSGAVPYGGYETISTTANYMSQGNVIITNQNNTISVFDGDCYPGVFEFNAQHAWYNSEMLSKAKGSLFYGQRQVCVGRYPIESDIDLSATYGDLYSRNNGQNGYYIQDKIASFDGYTQSKDAYLYNTAYNISPDAVSYSADDDTPIDSSKFDCRVHGSELKTNGEHIDNWLKFKPLNYIDVDTRFGSINNMRLFKDKLIFWQDNATGVLSINERTVINDKDDHDIIIGSGDILSRFDYVSTIYGMKPYQYEAEAQSHYGQYWWDGNNRELLMFGGEGIIPLTKSKGLTNYINQRQDSEHPMLAFDSKYDEILAQVVGNNETLVYNEQIQAFSSVYTYMPIYRANVGDALYISDDNCTYIQNKQAVEGYAILFGKPVFLKVRIVVNKNNIYTKTFDNLTFGGRMYNGSLPTIDNWPMDRVPGEYIKGEHLNAPMHHLIFTFETPLKQKSITRGDKATSVDEYDYRLAIPRNDSNVQYGNRMRGKTMQCEIASDYNSTDFSLQYITTKFRMSWS